MPSRNLDNPLLKEWTKAMVPYFEREQRRYGDVGILNFRPPPKEALALLEKLLASYEAPDRGFGELDPDLDALVSPFRVRHELVRTHAWAVPTVEALEAIRKHSPAGVVEIGAGGGYWAKLLRECGVDVLAYDTKPYASVQVNARWSEVRRGGPRMASRHPKRSLFLCWPPYSTPMAHDALCAYAGDTVLYVGEGSSGATGDDAFHEELEDNWHELEDEYVSLPQWPGIHDGLYVYKRGLGT